MSIGDGTLPAFDSRHNNAAQGHNPAFVGCSYDGCGSQDTVVITSREGRRCEKNVPQFDPAVAVELMRTDLGAACDYVRGTGLGGAA